MTKTYEILLFDLDNTLFDFEVSEQKALFKTAVHYGYKEHPEVFINAYHDVNKPLWQALERGEITSAFIKHERFKRLIAQLGISVEPEEMSAFYVHTLGEGIDVLPHARELCGYLKSKYKMAAVTNGLKAVQEKRLRLSEMDVYFDAVIISEEAGVSKPDPEIFEHALKKMGHEDKTTVLMIGDNLKADILGAKRAGIDGCWVNLKGEPEPDEKYYHWEIRHLSQLFEIL